MPLPSWCLSHVSPRVSECDVTDDVHVQPQLWYTVSRGRAPQTRYTHRSFTLRHCLYEDTSDGLVLAYGRRSPRPYRSVHARIDDATSNAHAPRPKRAMVLPALVQGRPRGAAQGTRIRSSSPDGRWQLGSSSTLPARVQRCPAVTGPFSPLRDPTTCTRSIF